MSEIDERELTDAERLASSDEPRPGVAMRDGQTLSQDETNELIWWELFALARGSDESEMLQAVWRSQIETFNGDLATDMQRGGLHSDPLIRLLAYRAWGERDRQWFEEAPQREICSYYGFERIEIRRDRDAVIIEAKSGARIAGVAISTYQLIQAVDPFASLWSAFDRLSDELGLDRTATRAPDAVTKRNRAFYALKF